MSRPLPAQKPKTGRPNLDHRRIVNGIIWVLKSGAPWRDLPVEGVGTTFHFTLPLSEPRTA